jgi:transcriptional regulator of acetoin/glycerol metabolism
LTSSFDVRPHGEEAFVVLIFALQHAISPDWNETIEGSTAMDSSVANRAIFDSWARCKSMGGDPRPASIAYVLPEEDLRSLIRENEKGCILEIVGDDDS